MFFLNTIFRIIRFRMIVWVVSIVVLFISLRYPVLLFAKNNLLLTSIEKEWLKENPVITLSVDNTYPPKNYINKKGQLVGISIDYIKLICKKAGLKINFQGSLWHKALRKAIQHKVDGVINADMLEERKPYLSFTKVYAVYPQALVVKKDYKELKGLKQCSGMKIAVKKNSSQLALLKNNYPKIKIIEINTVFEGLNLVIEGKVDGIFDDISVLHYRISQYFFTNLKFAFTLYDDVVGHSRIGIRKDKPILYSILNKAINAIREEEHRNIQKKWIPLHVAYHCIHQSKDNLFLTDQEKKWITEHPVIRVASNSKWAPVEYVNRNEEYQGIAIEYLKLLRRILGIEFNYVRNNTLAELVKMGKEKEIDLFPAISKTSERLKFLNFTDPYINFPIVILTRSEISYVGSLNDLSQKKIATVKHYAINNWIKKDYPDLKLRKCENVEEALILLYNKKIDAYIGNLAVIGFYIRKTGFTNLKVSGKTPYSYKLAIGVRKDWPVLINILNKALKNIPDNEKNNAFKKWIAIKYEHDFNYGVILKIIFACLTLITLIFLWNLSLKKQVHIKTVQLNNDIIKIKKIEKKVKKSLKEKEILLKEIHHRVKNNMQIISSLLSLQSDAINDKKFKELIQVSQNRIFSMGLVHEQLYRSDNFSKINFSNFISLLINQLLESYSIHNKIKLQLDLNNIYLNIDKAIPCALIINELIVNSIKYAFPGKKSGIISVRLTKQNNKICLIISDNGIGIPDNVNPEKATTLGLQLVYQLATQINGQLSREAGNGTRYKLFFLCDN